MKITIDEKAGTYTLTGTISPTPSKSGKSILLDSSHGTLKSGVKYNGKEVELNINISHKVAA